MLQQPKRRTRRPLWFLTHNFKKAMPLGMAFFQLAYETIFL